MKMLAACEIATFALARIDCTQCWVAVCSVLVQTQPLHFRELAVQVN